MASLSDARVRQLLEGRYIASFATHNANGSLHIVAVWFWFDGTDIYVATSSRSRKARNLEANPKVSLMIDARDPAASFGVTLTGTAQMLTGDSSRKCNAEIHRKYLSEAAIADPKVGPVCRMGRRYRPTRARKCDLLGYARRRSTSFWQCIQEQPDLPITARKVIGEDRPVRR
ncbi:MAG: pyridoxamine 5'-phosphate oxidase family protein [Acidobacteriota bacterium]